MLNPMQLLQSMPIQNPMIKNLMNMMKSGNSQGVEEFARNLFKERGRDFDKEFSEFKKNFNGFNK